MNYFLSDILPVFLGIMLGLYIRDIIGYIKKLITKKEK